MTASPHTETAAGQASPRWAGVDETVVEKVAAASGRPAWTPLINTDQGDLLLFLFLLAGAIGGFIAGYTFRGLFGSRKSAAARPLAEREEHEERHARA